MNQAIALQVLGLSEDELDFGKIQSAFNSLMDRAGILLTDASEITFSDLFQQRELYQKAYDFLCIPRAYSSNSTQNINIFEDDGDSEILIL